MSSECGGGAGESLIIKSPLDQNDYSYIKLENGFKVLLVSTTPHENTLTKGKVNPKTGVPLEVEEFNRKFVHIPDDEDVCGDSSDSDSDCWEPALKRSKLVDGQKWNYSVVSVSLCVGAGSLNDPEDIKGMAHFCEHMVCTYGSKKFPVGLMDFVNSQYGFMNAATYPNFTLYYYALPLKNKDLMPVLKQSLVMLADMMINPIFPNEKLQDEIKTVDSEFTLSETHDGNRLWQLFSSVFPEDHPLHTFPCGNRVTLNKQDLSKRLCEWKTRYYAAKYMTLVVSADLPLEDLEALAREHFSTIPKGDEFSPAEELPECYEDPFKSARFNRFYKVVPYYDNNIVWITWAIEDTKFAADFRTKPALYLATVLENANPLTDFLTRKNWIHWFDTDFGAESGLDLFCSPFTIYIMLTDIGVKEIFSVVQAVLSYLKVLGIQKPSEVLFNEIRRQRAEYFHFSPVHWYDAIGLSANLQRVKDPKYILTSRELATDFDPDFIQEFIKGLTPFNMNVILASKLHEDQCTKEEMYYKTKYCDYNFTKSYLRNCQKNMGFKLNQDFLNPFRVKDIICPVQNIVGMNYLRNDQKAVILHMKKSACSVGKIPYAEYIFYIRSPSVPSNERSSAFMKIWSYLLFEHLQKQIFQCWSAGFLVHHIHADSDGFFLFYLGKYSPKMPELIEAFFCAFMNLENILFEERFLTVLTLYRKFVNDSETDPFYHMITKLFYVLIQDVELTPEIKSTATGFGFQDFKNFLQVFKAEMQIRGYLMYCVPDNQARRISEIIGSLNYRPYPDLSIPKIAYSRAMMIPLGEKCLRFPAKSLDLHSNIVWNYYQIGIKYDWIALIILDFLLSSSTFKQLRTSERLSYYADGFVTGWGAIGVSILVTPQAAYYTTNYVDECIDAFLVEFRKSIASYNSLFEVKLLPENFKEWYTEEKHKLLLHLCDDFLLPTGSNRRKMTFQLTGNPNGGLPKQAQKTYQNANVIRDIAAFKDSMCIYNVEHD